MDLDLSENLYRSFDLFNCHLFDDKLETCFILIHRMKGSSGYFREDGFISTDHESTAHEIALTPETMNRGDKAIVSTLVHEMVHLWQATHGKDKPLNKAYHNLEWVKMMTKIGLIPTSTGRPGGKQTGTRVTHYVKKGGPFDKVFNEVWKPLGITFKWYANRVEKVKAEKTRSTFKCGCGQSCSAKIGAEIMCGICKESMKEKV